MYVIKETLVGPAYKVNAWYAKCPKCRAIWIAEEPSDNQPSMNLVSFCEHVSHAVMQQDSLYFLMAGKDIIVDRKE